MRIETINHLIHELENETKNLLNVIMQELPFSDDFPFSDYGFSSIARKIMYNRKCCQVMSNIVTAMEVLQVVSIDDDQFHELLINGMSEDSEGCSERTNPLVSVKKKSNEKVSTVIINDVINKNSIPDEDQMRLKQEKKSYHRTKYIQKNFHDYSMYEGTSGISLAKTILQEGYLKGHRL